MVWQLIVRLSNQQPTMYYRQYLPEEKAAVCWSGHICAGAWVGGEGGR